MLNLNPIAVPIPNLNRNAHFIDRSKMKDGHPVRRYRLFDGITQQVLPLPVLPIDWTKNNQLSFPMDDNDTLGDCFVAAMEHQDNTWTGNVGTQSVFNDAVTKAWYLQLAGGDNGLDNGTAIQGWKSGLPGMPKAVILDALNIDPTDAAMVQSAMELFGGVQFQLSVPDAWINNFKTGYVWDAGPGVSANPQNGHAILWNGCPANGSYKLQTWGTYGFITTAGVAVCDPTAFVALSPRWFNAAGYAPSGYHATQIAAFWVQAGGLQSAANALVAMFPAPAPPAPVPTPIPPGPTPPPVPVPVPPPTGVTVKQVLAAIDSAFSSLERRAPYLSAVLTYVNSVVDAAVTKLFVPTAIPGKVGSLPPMVLSAIIAAIDGAFKGLEADAMLMPFASILELARAAVDAELTKLLS